MRSIPSAYCGVAGVIFLFQWLSAPASALQLAKNYDAKTEPVNEANIALDAAAIKETDDLALKKEIYNNGRFSQYEDPKTFALVNRSLSSLSTDAAEIMKDDDMYNVFRWAFNYIGVEKEHEDLDHFDDRDVGVYADTIALDLFDLNVENIETEAAVVTGVWMTVVHYLYDAMDKCKSVPTATGDSLDGEESLDKAAAYWIGMEQEYGENESGHLMYSIAEKAGARFGQDNIETTVNTNIVTLMNQIKTDVIETGACQEESGYLQFRTLVDKIIAQMTVPLVQNLIHYSSERKEKFLELYALALVPQISACDPMAFDWFLEQLVMQDLDASVFNEVVSKLQSLYPCLGITCADVGSYRNGQVPECQDGSDGVLDMAGYKPSTDTTEIRNLDRDILRMEILMEWEAFRAASEIYSHGRNSVKEDGSRLSLEEYAKDYDRSAVPEYAWFSEYYDDPNYANTLIRNALMKTSIFEGASVDQRKEAVVRALQSMVMPMYALQQMHTAVGNCGSDKTAAAAAWDRGAAAYIGSIEGTETGGTKKGKFLYGLGNEMCSRFGVCGEGSPGLAEVNNQMIDFFTRGAESITSGSCGSLPNPTIPTSLVGDMKIVMIQGILHYAAVNDKLGSGAADGSIGAAHSLSRSMLPYMDKSVSTFAALVDENMKFDLSAKPVADGADTVFAAVAKTLSGMEVDCAKVGVYDSMIASGDVCALAGVTNPDVPKPTPSTPTQPAPSPTAPSPTAPPPTAAVPTQAAPEPAGGVVGYAFSTRGQDFGKIALDVQDISTSTIADAKAVYNNGKNAKITVDGEESITTLSSLSTDAESRYAQDRLYNIFRFSFKDEPVFTDGGTGSLADSSYANTVVAKALDVAEDTVLASEATVVMNIFMEIVHQLELAISSCNDLSINGALAIDTAAAYYIGSGQTKGDGSTGFSLYGLAESSAARYGQGSGEAPSNTKIIKLFKDAMLLTESCYSRPNDDPVELRRTINQIVSQMNVPLIRNLVYYMNAADADDNDLENFLELYALSIVPQLAGCNPGLFSYLRDELIDYEWDPNDRRVALDKLQDSLSCFGLTCADIGTLQVDAARDQLCGGVSEEEWPSFANYKPATDVTEYSVIDRDVLQISILVQMGALESAKNMYVHGQNSINSLTMNYRSLQDLATDDDRNVVDANGDALNPQFMRFSDYYENPYYADTLIMDALDKKAPFSTASNDQLKEVVMRSLQTMVTNMHSLQHLYTAIKQCRNSEERHGLLSWDRGAAVLLGSIESSAKIDDKSTGGQLMYALGNSMCEDFGKCSDSGNGVMSEKLIEYLTGGQLFLQDMECESAFDLITAGVVPALKVALVQGALHYASEMAKIGASASADGVLGAGHALKNAVVPLIDDSDAASARTIDSNMMFDLSRSPIPDGIDAIFDAFMESVINMDVDCEDVGTHQSTPARDICKPDAVKVSTPSSLADGLYVTTTYVADRAQIALDLRDMEKALNAGNTETARGIYEGGLNSAIYDKSGKKIGTRSLASFSTSAALVMAQEPTYNLFQYALKYDGSDTYLGGPVGLYADSIVQKAFTNQDLLLPVEAARVMNLWMYVVHELYQTVANCKRRLMKDDDGIQSIDEVAAYYIGDSQVTGSSEEGHSLYALAERMGESFGQDASGQTTVNTQILRLLNDAKLEISFPGACTTNPETHKRLRAIAHKIISQMTVPLIQSIIVNLANNDRERVKLYAQAVVPLIAGCNPATFEELYGKLIASDYNVVDVDSMIKSLQSSYECLGITCEDVGTYNDYGADCKETPTLSPLAGFVPQTDVRKFASLDLDIHNIRIFMQEKAYDAAMDYYTLGKYASVPTTSGETVFSLKNLATTSSRQVIPSFEYFERYFDSEFDDLDEAANYGDHIVKRALDTEALPLASPEQRTEMVANTLQYIIAYMAALDKMYEAIDDCESNDSRRNDNSANEWDRAAALMIGSLEGTKTGGSKHGLLLHSLSNKWCKDFNRCAASGNALLNEELITLLYSGRGETMGGNCQALRKTTREIESLIQVPLIQGTVWFAIVNEQLLYFDKNAALAEGYVFSRSVLPYVSEADGDAARVIKKNMDFQFDTEPVPDGARAVFGAFSKAIPEMGGVDCEKVGVVDGLGVCSTSASGHQYARLSLATLSVLGLSLVGHLLL